MKSKITYFMDKDSRLVVDNLRKIVINENLLVIYYTIKDEKTTVVRYIKNKDRIFIYDVLKKYNANVYEAFIEWANEKEIKWYSVKEIIINEKEVD